MRCHCHRRYIKCSANIVEYPNYLAFRVSGSRPQLPGDEGFGFRGLGPNYLALRVSDFGV